MLRYVVMAIVLATFWVATAKAQANEDPYKWEMMYKAKVGSTTCTVEVLEGQRRVAIRASTKTSNGEHSHYKRIENNVLVANDKGRESCGSPVIFPGSEVDLKECERAFEYLPKTVQELMVVKSTKVKVANIVKLLNSNLR